MKYMTTARDEAPEMLQADVREATATFAERLNAAIGAGLERKISAPTIISERPLPFYPVALPTEGPPVPLFKPKDYKRRVSQLRADHFERRAEVRPKPRPGRFTILDIDEDHCKYAVTDELPYLFCGAVTAEESPYCAQHDALCNRGFSGLRTKQDAAEYRQAFGGDGA